jgi:elongator complex protein 2
LYKKQSSSKSPYVLIQTVEEAHSRIIWGCSWTIEDKHFSTGSRDKVCKVWTRNGDKFEEKGKVICEQPVTAVNFLPILKQNKEANVLFVGFENGGICVYKVEYFKDTPCKFHILHNFHKFVAHSLTVKRIKSVVRDKFLTVSTCSEDFSVRVFEIGLEDFLNNYL